MKPNITYEQALEKASPRLQKLMQASVELLRKSEPLMLKYDPEDGGWCGFSGGKDSQALYHIAQLSGVKFKAFFSPTSVDPPQVIRFIRKEYPEVEFTRLKESIYTAFKRLKVLPTQRVRWCCALFKEKGGENKVTLTGVRKAESVKRSKRKEVEVSNYKFSGNLEEFEEYSEKRIKRIAKNLNQDQFSDVKESEIRCINGKDKIIINPIIDWTDKDVWEFLNDVMEVPHCELYDPPYNQTRIGCIGCPIASTKNQRKQLDMWPHVREKWIKAIMEVRKETYNEMLATPPTTPSATITWGRHQADAIASKIGRLGGGKSSIEDYAERFGRSEEHQGTWREYWRKIGGQCKFSDSVSGDCSTAGALYDEQTEREVAEYVIDWWISKKPFKEWYAETFLQQTINFDE